MLKTAHKLVALQFYINAFVELGFVLGLDGYQSIEKDGLYYGK